MKAVQIERYSRQIKTVLKDIDIPEINDDEILVKVKAAAVNPLDLLVMQGSIRLIQDYKMPVSLGSECAGVVESVGKNVHNFKSGDKVYARLPQHHPGAFAEFVSINQSAAAKMPENYSFKEAAAIPLAVLTAYQAITEELNAEKNKNLLITGGSGSFGYIAVPVAKALGLNVIVTGNSRAKENILSLGAARYIDYKKENYYDVLANIDYIIDTLGEKEFNHSLSVLKKGGTMVSLKGVPNKEFAVKNNFTFFKRLLFTLAGKKYNKEAEKQDKKYKFLFVRADGSQLKKITEIIEDNNIKPLIDEHTYSLDNIDDALNLLAKGNINGKIIVEIDK